LKAGFEAPIRIQPSRLLFYLHFLLDQKVPKNQENSIGLR
jgi:hypothetical protein